MTRWTRLRYWCWFRVWIPGALIGLFILACRQPIPKREAPVLMPISVPVTVRLQYNTEERAPEIIVTIGDSSAVRVIQGKRAERTNGWTQVRGIGLDGREFIQFETRVVGDSIRGGA